MLVGNRKITNVKRLIKILKYRLAIKFKYFQRILLSEEEKRKLDIAELRANFMFFGHDMSDMTDEEVMDGLKDVCKVFSSFGCTTEEAAKAFKVLSTN